MTLSMQSKILMFLLIAALLFPAVIGILAIVPLNPIEVKSIIVVNHDKKVVAGTTLHYIIDSVKYTDKPCKIIRQLINERTIHYTSIESNIPPGESKRRGELNTAKSDMIGRYYMRWTAIYTYFYFRDVIVTVDSEPFEMVCAEDK